jgi:hypothetical protein
MEPPTCHRRFSSIGSSGLGCIATGAFRIEVLCDRAITVRTIGREMRELLFYGHCGRNDIFRFRHLHKIAAEFEHQTSFDIAAVNPVNHLDRVVEVVWKPRVPAPSSPLPARPTPVRRARSLPAVASLAQRPQCSHSGGPVPVRCRLQLVDDILRFARMDCSGLWVHRAAEPRSRSLRAGACRERRRPKQTPSSRADQRDGERQPRKLSNSRRVHRLPRHPCVFCGLTHHVSWNAVRRFRSY